MTQCIDKLEYKNQIKGTMDSCTIYWVKNLTSQKYTGDIITFLYNNYLKKFIGAISKTLLLEFSNVKNQYNSANNYFQINNELNKIKYNDSANSYFLNVMNWSNTNMSFDIVKIWNLLHMPRYKIADDDIRISDDIVISPICEQLKEFISFLTNSIDYITFLYSNNKGRHLYIICLYTKKVYTDTKLQHMDAQILELKNVIESISNRTPRYVQPIYQPHNPIVPPIKLPQKLDTNQQYSDFEDMESLSSNDTQSIFNVATCPPPENYDILEYEEDSLKRCIICCEVIIEKYVLVPCGHANICTKCYNDLKQKDHSTCCPTCRQNVENYIKIFT